MKLKNKILGDLMRIKARRMSRRASADDSALLTNQASAHLTPSELDDIKKMWGGLDASLRYGYPGFTAYKSLCGFSADFVPSAYYYPYIVRALNPGKYYRAFENKSLMPRLFPEIKQPEIVAEKVRGNLIVDDRPIDGSALAQYIDSLDEPLIVKQASESCCGRNIKVMEPLPGRGREISRWLTSSPDDMIVQRLVKSSKSTAIFNPSSLNTFRVTTLYINGEISLCSRAIKMGKPGNFVDNIGGEGGGIIVGVSEGGVLADTGFGSTGRRYESHGDVRFGGMTIKDYDKVDKLAVDAHRLLPYCGIVGWDIALDDCDEAVLIEANLWWPGTLLEQLCSGPMFGRRTEEVIDYAVGRKLEL